MITPPIPTREKERLHELLGLHILNSLPEAEYDAITRIAGEICGTSIALISLIDSKRQWFKSRVGLAVEETPRDLAFCAHAINTPDEILEVEDARNDERFHDNPLVTGEPHVIFYTGVPLVSAEGNAFGTLCVIDSKPKKLNEGQLQALKDLSAQVMRLFELRRAKRELEEAIHDLEKKNELLRQFAGSTASELNSPLNNIILLSSRVGQLTEPNGLHEAKDIAFMINVSANALRKQVLQNLSKGE